MSFSHEVKEKLVHNSSEYSKGRFFELGAYFRLLGEVCDGILIIKTDNILGAKRIIILLKEFYPDKYRFTIQKRKGLKKPNYIVQVNVGEENLSFSFADMKNEDKIGFLRGAFLSHGSITDPKKNYHLEIRCPNINVFFDVKKILDNYSLKPKEILKDGKYYIYLKDGDAISDFLKIIGAHSHVCQFEEIRLIKSIKNNTNRNINCEVANIDKTVKAAREHIEAIKKIEKKYGLSSLPEDLREVAEYRVKFPEKSLVELGECFKPSILKSKVNYKLKKIMKIAEEI